MTRGVIGPRCVGIACHPRRISARANGVAVPWHAGIAGARLVVVTSTRLVGNVAAGLDGIAGSVHAAGTGRVGSECLHGK